MIGVLGVYPDGIGQHTVTVCKWAANDSTCLGSAVGALRSAVVPYPGSTFYTASRHIYTNILIFQYSTLAHACIPRPRLLVGLAVDD